MDLKNKEKAIQKLERKIGVSEKFFTTIFLSENDWSFIVKLHSFLEAACTELITSALGKSEIGDIISRLEMSNKSQGKIAFIKNLSLLESRTRGYLRKLSEIRNFYVHNVKSIFLSLEQYVESLNAQQIKEFIYQIGYGIKDKFKLKNGKIIEKNDFIKNNPRIAIFISASSVLLEISDQIKLEEVDIKEKEFYKEVAETFITLAKQWGKNKL